MRVAISYPPIVNAHGQKAMVSQNRNVQYFKKPTYLLPVTYAQAATWLQQSGHAVYWDDANAQLKTYQQWLDDLVAAGGKPAPRRCMRVRNTSTSRCCS